ncbi:hypothetical protein DWY90_09960 [Coprococcus sp. AF27-8]|nr:hypothetical protein DWY90_09960 [Coprococcus sp. AF27-8]
MNVLEKILEEMKKIKDGNRKEKLYGKYPPQNKRQETLNAYSQGYEANDWIPVEEWLPKARQHDNGEPIEFIAMIKGAGVPTVLSINEQDEWFSYDEMFYGEGRYNNYDVVAWKPLPEPYIKNPK